MVTSRNLDFKENYELIFTNHKFNPIRENTFYVWIA